MRKPVYVNAIGIKEIQEFLAANHKRGAALGDREVKAWAAQADFQLGEGNTPTIEICGHDSKSGHTETFTVSDAGCDWAEVWEAWLDGRRDEAERFLVPEGGTFDVAEAGARALGVEISEELNVARV